MEKNLTKGAVQGIVIYKDAHGNVELKADVKKETIWATQEQIVQLFDVDQSVVSRHIKNTIKDGEIDEKSNMQKMHNANSDKPVTLYSLDIILAVGYRTNSAKAIAFRKWASGVLREYILKGVVVNADRIEKLHETGIHDLREKIAFIQRTVRNRELDRSEVDSLLSVIDDYANSWLLLKKYDEGELKVTASKTRESREIDYDFALLAISKLKADLVGKGDAGQLFGNMRDDSFGGILRTLYQTYGGKELYTTLEIKAAHLLYFIIKDHPFSDGNKRIGSFLFIVFLERNKILFTKNGDRKIASNTLVALALLIAESDPKEKDMMIALVTHLIA